MPAVYQVGALRACRVGAAHTPVGRTPQPPDGGAQRSAAPVARRRRRGVRPVGPQGRPTRIRTKRGTGRAIPRPYIPQCWRVTLRPVVQIPGSRRIECRSRKEPGPGFGRDTARRSPGRSRALQASRPQGTVRCLWTGARTLDRALPHRLAQMMARRCAAGLGGPPPPQPRNSTCRATRTRAVEISVIALRHSEFAWPMGARSWRREVPRGAPDHQEISVIQTPACNSRQRAEFVIK
jgi:hypothetical protein